MLATTQCKNNKNNNKDEHKDKKFHLSTKLYLNHPITYEIYYDGDDKKNTPAIFFGIPQNHASYIKQRVQGVLPESTLTFEEDYKSHFQDCYVCEYIYEKDSMLSLKIKDNNFLQSMLNIKNDIQKGEKILFQVEMTPIGGWWKEFQDEKWDKVRKGKDVTTRGDLLFRVLDGANKVVDDTLSILDEVMEYKPQKTSRRDFDKDDDEKKRKNTSVSQYSTSSKTKKNNDAFIVRVRAYISCRSRLLASAYATTIETAMRDLEEDNRLVARKVRKGKLTRGNVDLAKFNPTTINIMSSKEVASIINIPNKKLQRQFNMSSIKVKQIAAPKQMCKGKVLLGHLKKHGKTIGVFLSEDRDLTCLPLFLLTKMGGGKTTFFLSLCNDAINAGHGLVLFDYIGDNELSVALQEIHPNKCKIIKFSELKDLCTIAFPEIEVLDADSPYDRKKKANTLAKEVKYLINSMAHDTEDISRIMSLYLTSACKIVFCQPKQTLLNVYEALVDGDIRKKYIDRAISMNIFDEGAFEIRKMRELDDKPEKADHLLNRFSVILEDTILQDMLEAPYENNVNFAEIMNDAKPVIIQMDQDTFTTHTQKDIMCTYFMSRIRLAMSKRKNKDHITHVVVDELHQIPNTMKLVSDTIAEPRKFSLQYIMSMHSLSQFPNKEVKDKIMDVGCNFMILKGTTPKAFGEFKDILGDEWTYDDLKDMDYDFGSINAFSVDNAYKVFVTELPKPLRDKKGKLYIGKEVLN